MDAEKAAYIERVSLNDVAKVKREKSAIEQELSQVHEALEYLHNLVNTLEDRVQPVSYSEPEAMNDGLAEGPRGSSQFYMSVFEARSQVERLHEKVKNITRKLEV